MRATLKTALILGLLAFPVAATADGDRKAIQQVVESAYVRGIHIERDPGLIRAGFHPSFVMFVVRDGQVQQVDIESWIERIEESKRKEPDAHRPETTYRFTQVDAVGDAAVVRIEIFRDGDHVFTDFLSLYRFEDGWKIVGKIYHRHPTG